MGKHCDHGDGDRRQPGRVASDVSADAHRDSARHLPGYLRRDCGAVGSIPLLPLVLTSAAAKRLPCGLLIPDVEICVVTVATLRPALRVARLRAERTFSLLAAKSDNGTLMAIPSRTWSRSDRIWVPEYSWVNRETPRKFTYIKPRRPSACVPNLFPAPFAPGRLILKGARSTRTAARFMPTVICRSCRTHLHRAPRNI